MRAAGRPRKAGPKLDPSLFVRVCQFGCHYYKPAIEPWSRWLVRKFCSPVCYHRSRRAEPAPLS